MSCYKHHFSEIHETISIYNRFAFSQIRIAVDSSSAKNSKQIKLKKDEVKMAKRNVKNKREKSLIMWEIAGLQ